MLFTELLDFSQGARARTVSFAALLPAQLPLEQEEIPQRIN